MAKLCKPILEYKEKIKSAGISPDNYSPPKKTMQRFIRLFKPISDERIEAMIKYPLVEIILIAFLAILCNASTWTEIEQYGKAKVKWLKKFIKLKEGIPSHDTFRRVFALIDPVQLEIATVNFLMENLGCIKRSLNIKESGPRLICVDGKEEKGTGRKHGTDEEVRNMQMLHVYDASAEICLFSRMIDKKTNEIPVAQEVLKQLQLNECIVSFDALHTQKDTIEIIVEKKGDYVGALKDNQGSLAEEAKNSFTEEAKGKIKKEGTYYYESSEKAHNQIEVRQYYMIKAKQKYDGKKSWKKLRYFVCNEKHTCNIVTGKKVTETRYYITSLQDIELCAESIRGHWGIENSLHWHLDFSFQEDDNATMDKNAFLNMSLLNKMALSLHKLVQPLMKNSSIRSIKKTFGWNSEDSISLILNAFDEETIRNALEKAWNKN